MFQETAVDRIITSAEIALEEKVEVLQDRLAEVADLLIKHGLLNNTPYDKERFVQGQPLSNFPGMES